MLTENIVASAYCYYEEATEFPCIHHKEKKMKSLVLQGLIQAKRAMGRQRKTYTDRIKRSVEVKTCCICQSAINRDG